MVILFSSSNLKQKLLQVRFEIRKKEISSIGILESPYALTNYNSSIRGNVFHLTSEERKEKKKEEGGEKKRNSRKRKSARGTNTGSQLVRNQTKATLCASCIREQGGGREGVEEEEATLRGAPVNTFSDVVICRWFRPAGGQPFFHAFLRLPDLNPLKRLEQLFRVISSKGVGEVKLSRGGRIHPPKAKMQNTLENTGPKRLTGTLPRESSPARSYPMKIMQKKILPPL